MYLTFLRDKRVVGGCEADVGDGDLVEFVCICSIFVVLFNTFVAKQWSSQMLIEFCDSLGLYVRA